MTQPFGRQDALVGTDNHLQTNRDHCSSCCRNCSLVTCGKFQIMFRIISSCLQPKLEDGLPWLHLA